MPRLTDKQKKRIIADWVELGSYNAVAKKHKVSATTVKKVVQKDSDSVDKCERKKEENTTDILTHMEKNRDKVCLVIDRYLDALMDEERIEKATPAQLTTAMGTLIDKFTARGGSGGAAGKDDPITKSLKEARDNGAL